MKTNPDLNHPAYTGVVRLKGYNWPVTVQQACTPPDAGKVLIRLNPDWTKQDHKTLAAAHQAASSEMEAKWNALVDEAAMQTFGRKFQFSDYRISGIAAEEFSPEHKEQLRTLAHARTKHSRIAQAHTAAAKSRLTRVAA